MSAALLGVAVAGFALVFCLLVVSARWKVRERRRRLELQRKRIADREALDRERRRLRLRLEKLGPSPAAGRSSLPSAVVQGREARP